MPTKLTCPQGHAMLVRDQDLGKRLRCPVCKVPLDQAPRQPLEEKLPTAALVLDPDPLPEPELLPDFGGATGPAVGSVSRPADRPGAALSADELAQRLQRKHTKGERRRALRFLRVGLTLDFVAFICLLAGSSVNIVFRLLA